MEVDELIPLSALQHVVFCPRQAALIHVERAWREDAATADGRVLHERVDVPGVTNREGVRVARSLPLVSIALGVSGIADIVELREDRAAPKAIRPYPVEMKRGRIKREQADRVQLCAQAICLEEMFEVRIDQGALYYGKNHRRVVVDFTAALRAATAKAAREMRAFIDARLVPPPAYAERKCRSCSLEPICLPAVVSSPERASRHVRRLALLEERT